MVAASAASEVRDLADLLGQRSPGTRTQDELTKHARAESKMRARPKVAQPGNPLGPEIPSTTALVDRLQPPLLPVGVMKNGFEPPLSAPPSLGSILVPVDQISSPPGNGGPVHIPSSEPRDTPPVSAVPEPGTWAMMLTGFGLIAWRTRRRSAAKKVTPASA